MTQHQYEIVKALRRIWGLRRLFGGAEKSGIVTKHAEIELAGQAAVESRPPLSDEGGAGSMNESS